MNNDRERERKRERKKERVNVTIVRYNFFFVICSTCLLCEVPCKISFLFVIAFLYAPARSYSRQAPHITLRKIKTQKQMR